MPQTMMGTQAVLFVVNCNCRVVLPLTFLFFMLSCMIMIGQDESVEVSRYE